MARTLWKSRFLHRAARSLALGAALLHLSAPAAPGGDVPAGVPAEELEAAALRAQLKRWASGDPAAAGVLVLDARLAERIHRVRAASPTFAEAWERLERRGVPVVVGTSGQLESVLPGHVRASASRWAGITVTWGGSRGTLERAAVAIRLDWLEGLHRSYGNPESAFLEAVDGLLIHEIYGHLAPVVEARNIRAACADPAPGERLEESCVGRRELALRAERAR